MVFNNCVANLFAATGQLTRKKKLLKTHKLQHCLPRLICWTHEFWTGVRGKTFLTSLFRPLLYFGILLSSLFLTLLHFDNLLGDLWEMITRLSGHNSGMWSFEFKIRIYKNEYNKRFVESIEHSFFFNLKWKFRFVSYFLFLKYRGSIIQVRGYFIG